MRDHRAASSPGGAKRYRRCSVSPDIAVRESLTPLQLGAGRAETKGVM
jgi:hypothetical protein